MTIYVIIKIDNGDMGLTAIYPSGYKNEYEAEMQVTSLEREDADGLYSYLVDKIEFDGACNKCAPHEIKCGAV